MDATTVGGAQAGFFERLRAWFMAFWDCELSDEDRDDMRTW